MVCRRSECLLEFKETGTKFGFDEFAIRNQETVEDLKNCGFYLRIHSDTMVARPAREADVADSPLVFGIQPLNLNIEGRARRRGWRSRDCDCAGRDDCGGSVDVDSVAIAEEVYQRAGWEVVAIIYRSNLNSGNRRGWTNSTGAKSKCRSSIR